MLGLIHRRVEEIEEQIQDKKDLLQECIDECRTDKIKSIQKIINNLIEARDHNLRLVATFEAKNHVHH